MWKYIFLGQLIINEYLNSLFSSPSAYRGSNKENIPVGDGPDYDNLSDSDEEFNYHQESEYEISSSTANLKYSQTDRYFIDRQTYLS